MIGFVSAEWGFCDFEERHLESAKHKMLIPSPDAGHNMFSVLGRAQSESRHKTRKNRNSCQCAYYRLPRKIIAHFKI